jgi:hypothetical protein
MAHRHCETFELPDAKDITFLTDRKGIVASLSAPLCAWSTILCSHVCGRVHRRRFPSPLCRTTGMTTHDVTRSIRSGSSFYRPTSNYRLIPL